MQLGSSFLVPADPITVFENFLEPATMKACIPGCEELVRVDETHYQGRLVNTVAHVKFNAAFAAEILELDPPRQVRALLKGEDMRLGSSLQLNATLAVEPDGDASLVTYTIEMALWGKLGRLGESIFRRRTAEVEQQFVAAFSAACAGQPVAAESVTPSPAQVSAATPELTGTGVPAAVGAGAGVVTDPRPGSGPAAAPPAPAGEPATADGPVGYVQPAPVDRPQRPAPHQRPGVWQRLVATVRRLFAGGRH